MTKSLTLFISNVGPYDANSQPIHHVSTPGADHYGPLQGIQGTYLFRVLDRANPANTPLFTGTSDSPNEVPNGMSPFVDDRHIVIVSMRADITKVPQGPLYEFLSKECGAGSVLAKIEMLNTGFACGVTNLQFSYFLVAVPGQAVPSVEHMGFSKQSSWNTPVRLNVPYPPNTDDNWKTSNPNHGLYAASDRWARAYATNDEMKSLATISAGVDVKLEQPDLLVVQLIPGSDGLYTPVRVP